MTEVTVCIPAWQAEAFVAETLRSALQQTRPPARVVVSVDRGEDATAEVCRTLAADSPVPVTVVEQPDRLGWVGNVNAALDLVDTERFAILFHDDVLAPTYLQALHDVHAAQPATVCAYTDQQRRGLDDSRPSVPSFDGPRPARMLQQVVTETALPMRGLMPTTVLHDVPRLADRGFNALGAGVVWLLGIAAHGPMIRHPEPLYTKTIAVGSVTDGFRTADAQWRLDAHVAMAEQVRSAIRRADLASGDRAVLEQAALLRARERTANLLRAVPADRTPPDPATEEALHGRPLTGPPGPHQHVGRAAPEPLRLQAGRTARALALLARRDGREEDELAHLALGVAVAPEDAVAAYLHADALRRAGAFTAAVEESSRAVARSPERAQPWVTHVACLRAAGREEEAQQVLDRARSAVPREAAGYGRLESLVVQG